MIRRIYQFLFSARLRLKIKKKRIWLLSILYHGNKYSCNICGKTSRKFITHGHIPRKNARCPNCLSLERTRVLLFYLENEININHENLKILHFAPEPGLEEKLRKIPTNKYITADINPEAADIQVDIIDIPFIDNSFDLIICSHVLVEVPEEIKALKELRRVVNKHGCVLLITQIFNNQLTDNLPMYMHKKEREKTYGANICRTHGIDFSSIVAQTGFNVEVIDYRHVLGSEMIKKYSLGAGNFETIFKCSKK
ncbi:class I SAM-dependent methyltransferase [Marinilabiliaceae bacterium JC017]|nr:class I SAM-dependent methyltransferase [Marinilabiliaceae bacterium JC017]